LSQTSTSFPLRKEKKNYDNFIYLFPLNVVPFPTQCFIFQGTYFNGEKQSVFKIDKATKYAARDKYLRNIFEINLI